VTTYQALGPAGFGTYCLVDGALQPSSGSAEALLVPGFVDIHIHGGFGIDFMSASSSEIVSWADQLALQGYEAFLPTTVTASAAAVKAALGNLPEHPMIAGFHLEGPFISDTFPGAQPQEFIVTPDEAGDDWASILADPRLRVITIAPEIDGALDLIELLTSRGVIVSLGHTNATFDECIQAAGMGARHLTHTYNAMRPLHHREAGTVGFALSAQSPDLCCELIYDRHHVCRDAADILRRSRPSDKLIAISDGTMAAGLPDGQSLTMWDIPVSVQNGTVRLEDGTLAGSAITLLDAFRNLFEDFGPETAIRACCINPRQDLGLQEVKTWLVLDEDLQIIDRL